MPRLLMMEGNTRARVEEVAARGGRSASDGYIHALRAHFPDLPIDVIFGADRDGAPPRGAAIQDYDGFVVGGSGLRAFDNTFEVTNQIEIMKEFAKSGRPILGSCWGLQIAAIAAGGAIGPSPNGREFGFARKITLTQAGRDHRFYAGKPTTFDAPCIHYDEITETPPGTIVLSANRHSAVQAAIVPVDASQVWGVQYHPEFELTDLAMLADFYEDALAKDGFFAGHNDGEMFRADMRRLHHNPDDAPLAWRTGLDSDVLDPTVRRAEIINWVEACILRRD